MAKERDLLSLAKAKAHHLPNGRFTNPWFKKDSPALSQILKWKISHLLLNENPRFPVLDPRPFLKTNINSTLVSFLGHSTVFLSLNGKFILFDPIFSHIGGFIKRHTRPPLEPEALPPISYVVLSHAHRDHCDLNALRKIPGRFKVIAPLGLSRYLQNKNLIELDWFEEFAEDGLTFLSLPAQHWSKRNLTDTNLSLWASFLVTDGRVKIFLGGDTGYFFGFREIGKLYGPVDLALLPAGAFLPRWLMAPFHLSPEEAVQAALELGAKQATPIHWGAYKLGDEALDDPPKLFKLFARQKGLSSLILYPGEVALYHGRRFRVPEASDTL